jgi:hypothetical protein
MEHEWVEVLNRRWCLCCAAFQQRKSLKSDWPAIADECARDTPYAARQAAEAM